MSGGFSISFDGTTLTADYLHASDVDRLQRAWDTTVRNYRIRKRYAELRAAGVSQPDAIAKIAREEHLSEDAVNLIIWPR